VTGGADRPAAAAAAVLERLTATIAARRGAAASTSYVAKLFAGGEDAVLRKVIEEAAEVLLASKEGDKLHVVREVADLWFHSLVLLALHDATAVDVLEELARREGVSGLSEKAARADGASR
jgi:phosphoribosyl-ATP pyrophosphohydrolase